MHGTWPVRSVWVSRKPAAARVSRKPVAEPQSIARKKKNAHAPGASSAHSIRDIMMHSPHVYPGHSTCYVPVAVSNPI